MVSKLKKCLICAVSAVMAFTSTAITAFADEPYNTYSYDNWGDPIPSQAGYRVERTVTGLDMGLEQLSDPESDLFISENENPQLSGARDFFIDQNTKTMWLADSGNNRILRLNMDLEVTGVYKTFTGGTISTLENPMGVFATSDSAGNTTLYIADSDNQRAIRTKITGDMTAEIEVEYTKPDSAAYTAEAFNPSKILADKEGNAYLVCTSVSTGALRYDSTGTFRGFYGANRVEQTADVIARKGWRVCAADEQLQAMTSSVPTEFNNFDIDDQGFVYTVTESANASTDAVKKLNPAGYNIWDNAVGNKYEFGDFASGYDESTAISTKLTDVVIGDNGVINILDYETGRVFQYDEDATLLFIFGTRSTPSEQEGSFTAPNAVETMGTNVFVLDGTKNDITVFTETVFGKYVHAASVLYVEGRYTDAQPLWEEVMRRDGEYTLAHVALGKAELNNGNYASAMEYFKTAYDQEDYDKAFEYYRDDLLRNNFEIIVSVLLALVILIIVYVKLKKHKKIKSITEYIVILCRKIRNSFKKSKKEGN